MTAIQPLKRVQVLLPHKTYEMLQQIATEKQESMSALVRQAVEDQLIQEERLQRKARALASLSSMNLPIDDWDTVETELMESRYHEYDS